MLEAPINVSVPALGFWNWWPEKQISKVMFCFFKEDENELLSWIIVRGI